MTEGGTAPTPDGEGSRPDRSLRDLARDRRVGATALIAAAALVALAVWLIVESVSDDDGGGGTATASQTTGPVAVSASGLGTLAQAAGSPIYWVGPRPGMKYELRRTDGQVYVRYLPSDVAAGDPRGLLTVATYPVEDAFDVTSRLAGSGIELIPLEGGGVAAVSMDRPTSAYVAFPGVDYQIEVYDPDPAVVRELATGGAVQPVPEPQQSAQARGPEEATEAELAALPQELGHEVYWAGSRADDTYELTVTAEGSVFIRYLAPGVNVGSEPGALTVATYPLADAYQVTKKTMSQDNVSEDVPGGGISVHRKDNRNNVYLAYPNVDLQIEVYSPVPGEAAGLVRQGEIVPVG